MPPKRVAAAHQPHYLPWLGYIHKILLCDVFVLLDTVQFTKNGWINRNKIKTSRGWQWITVPVFHRFGDPIIAVKIDRTQPWQRKHLQTLVSNYSHAAFFDKYRPAFDDIYCRQWEHLVDLNCTMLERLLECLHVRRELVRASDMKLPDGPTERLIGACKAVGATTYLSGPDGMKYMCLERFLEEGIEVIFQDFCHPVYPQLYGDCVRGLSVVDLLFNCGEESSRIILQY